MVHTLHESWRVLRKNGLLVDLRPLHADMTIEAVLNDEAQLIRKFTDEYRYGNDLAADKAMDTVTDENLFQLVSSAPFEYVKFYDTGEELLNYYAERNPPIQQPDDVVAQIRLADRNVSMTLRVTTPMLLETYRRLSSLRT